MIPPSHLGFPCKSSERSSGLCPPSLSIRGDPCVYLTDVSSYLSLSGLGRRTEEKDNLPREEGSVGSCDDVSAGPVGEPLVFRHEWRGEDLRFEEIKENGRFLGDHRLTSVFPLVWDPLKFVLVQVGREDRLLFFRVSPVHGRDLSASNNRPREG